MTIRRQKRCPNCDCTADPRICRTPPPWDHLTLGEIDELKRLWRKLVGDGLNSSQQTRLIDLSQRRFRPQYEPRAKGAA